MSLSLALALALAAPAVAGRPVSAAPWVSRALATSCPDLEQLMCQAAREHSLTPLRRRAFEYHMEDVLEKQDGRGRVSATETKIRYIHRSRPDGVPINETIAETGTSFTAADREESKQYVQDRVRKLDSDPVERAKSIAREASKVEDRGNDLQFEPGSLQLRLEGLGEADGKPCWVVSYRPHSAYRGRKDGFLHRSTGVVWIGMDRPAFLRLELDFIDKVSLGAGPFATIGPGSHLFSTLTEVEPGQLLVDTVDMELKIKILFVANRNERRITRYRDYQRVLPPWPEFAP